MVMGFGPTAEDYETAQLKADFLAELKSSLQRNYWQLKVAYDLGADMFLGDDRGDVTVLIPYNSIVSTMKRWRRTTHPPCPNTLAEMAQQLEQPENFRLLQYGVGRHLSTRQITDGDGNLHLMIFDEQFVRSQFANVSKLFIDGTFQTTPRLRDVYQLVPILGITYGHAIPFVHVLMANKTEAAYTAVLTAVSHIINVDDVKLVMSDFEQALRNSSRQVFPNARIAGCSVHYDRALLKKIKTLHLMDAIRDNEDARLFLKNVMALAYLPEQLIVAQFRRLENTLGPALRHRFSGFIAYYTRQWLQRVKPEGFSVFRLSRRTNNVSESYNSVLAHHFGRHPSAWDFMVKLMQLTLTAVADVTRLVDRKQISRHPRYQTIYKQRELVGAWIELTAGEITTEEFLNQAARLKGNVREILNRIPDEDLQDGEDELEDTPNNALRDDLSDYDVRGFPDRVYDFEINRNPDALVEDALGVEDQNPGLESDDSQSSIGFEAPSEDALSPRRNALAHVDVRDIDSPAREDLWRNSPARPANQDHDVVTPRFDAVRNVLARPVNRVLAFDGAVGAADRIGPRPVDHDIVTRRNLAAEAAIRRMNRVVAAASPRLDQAADGPVRPAQPVTDAVTPRHILATNSSARPIERVVAAASPRLDQAADGPVRPAQPVTDAVTPRRILATNSPARRIDHVIDLDAAGTGDDVLPVDIHEIGLDVMGSEAEELSDSSDDDVIFVPNEDVRRGLAINVLPAANVAADDDVPEATTAPPAAATPSASAPASSAEREKKRAAASRKKNLRRKKREKEKRKAAQESGVPPPRKPRRNKCRKKNATKCVVCRARTPMRCFRPCGHVCCCQECADAYVARGIKVCPVCRKIYTEIINTFFP